jgi:hypothetical protein
MENVTVPLPVPFAPAVIVIHDGALLTAVHGQTPFEAITLTLPDCAAAETFVLVADNEYEQLTAA